MVLQIKNMFFLILDIKQILKMALDRGVLVVSGFVFFNMLVTVSFYFLINFRI